MILSKTAICFDGDEIIEYGTVNPLDSTFVDDDNDDFRASERGNDFTEVVDKRKRIHDMNKSQPKAGPIIPNPPFKASEGKLSDTGPVTFIGSPLFMKCQRQTTKKWDELVKDIPRAGDGDESVDVSGVTSGLLESVELDQRWEMAWYELANKFKIYFEDLALTEEEVKAIKEPKNERGSEEGYYHHQGHHSDSGHGGVDIFEGSPYERAKKKIMQAQKDLREAISQAKGKKSLLRKCTALVPLTSFIDYNEPKNTLNPIPKASLDGKITCSSKGGETQDYPTCVKVVDAWNGFVVSKMAVQQIQNIKYTADSTDRELLLAQDAQSATPNALLPLQFQREGVDDQSSIAFQRTGFHLAQLAVLKALRTSYVKHKDVMPKCESVVGENLQEIEYKLFIDWIKQIANAWNKIAQPLGISFDRIVNSEENLEAKCRIEPMGMMMGG
ncbi:MAG: hypothetical protein OEY33_05705, partial [Bdellovibrionales bacterium]|nr:hypothetical protein [Bdellovibrionales bacterium]